jgi:hypothetical protein
MVLSPEGLRPKQDCDGEEPAPTLNYRHYKITNSQLSKENFKEKQKLVTGRDGGLTPGQTG